MNKEEMEEIELEINTELAADPEIDDWLRYCHEFSMMDDEWLYEYIETVF